MCILSLFFIYYCCYNNYLGGSEKLGKIKNVKRNSDKDEVCIHKCACQFFMCYHDIVAVYSIPGYALCIMMINFFNNVMSFFFFFLLFGPSFLWQRNVVEVEWMETNNKNIYRVGLKGKVRKRLNSQSSK